MKPPSKRLILLSMIVSLLGGVALAAFDLSNMHRAINLAHEISEDLAKSFGETAIISEPTTTVSVALCIGLIPVGVVDHPYLVVAVGDAILGSMVTGLAILIIRPLRRAFSRDAQLNATSRSSSHA